MLHYYGLRKTARLIGNSVRRRKLIISAKLHRKPELAEGWRLNLSAFPPKGAPHAEWINEIERRSLSSIFSLEAKVRHKEVKFLRKIKSSKEKKIASLFLGIFLKDLSKT